MKPGATRSAACAMLAVALLLAGCTPSADTPDWPEVGTDGTGEAVGYIAAIDYQPVETDRWEGSIDLVESVEDTTGARFDIEPESRYVSASDPTRVATLQEAFEFLFRKLEAEDTFVIRFHMDGERYVIDDLVPQAQWGDVFFTDGPVPEAPPPDLTVAVQDEDGRTPIDAVSSYFDAVASADANAIWDAYSPEGAPGDRDAFLADWEANPWSYEDVDFLEQRVLSEEDALVRIAYRVRSGDQVVEIGWPGEWWRVEKVGGRWYVGWMPRQ